MIPQIRTTGISSDLWERISSYQIDDPDSSFKFSHRLQRENMWDEEYTHRVIEEYKRFLFLCVIDPPVTPSVDVDECWHLHMIYTRDYWDILCGEVLGKNIHHGPTRGGKKEDDRYVDLYEKTKKLYFSHFGYPPNDIWPASKIRFAPQNIVRLDLNKHWVTRSGDIKAIFKIFIQYLKSKLKI